MRKNILITLFTLLGFCVLPIVITAQQAAPTPYRPPYKVNNIRTWDPVKPDTNKNNFTVSSDITAAKMATQYIDGLGRPIQTVVKKGSMATGGSAVDIVSAIT